MMRSDTSISSLAPGFAGERAGVRGLSRSKTRPPHPRRFFAVRVGCWISTLAFALNLMADEPVLNLQIAVNEQPNLNVEEDQLKRMIRMELAFLRRAVQLTAEQDQQLSGFDFTKLETARIKQRKIAPGVDFNQIQVEGGVAVRIVRANAGPDPLRIRQIERAFEKEIDAVLTEVQKPVYASEKQSRDDFNHEISIRGMLMLLDKRLSLSKGQCQEIRAQLSKWDGIKSIDTAPYESAGNYLPAIPDSLLVEYLSDSQREILQSIPRIDFGQQGQMRQQFIGDIVIPR